MEGGDYEVGVRCPLVFENDCDEALEVSAVACHVSGAHPPF